MLARQLAIDGGGSPHVVEYLKSVVAAGSTANLSALFNPMVVGFLESLRSISIFDRLLAA